MRALIIATLMAIGIGLIGLSGSTAAPASGAALRHAASNILPVVPVRDVRGGFRRGQSRHSSSTYHKPAILRKVAPDHRQTGPMTGIARLDAQCIAACSAVYETCMHITGLFHGQCGMRRYECLRSCRAP